MISEYNGFYVGETVKILHFVDMPEKTDFGFVDEMCKWCGTQFVISKFEETKNGIDDKKHIMVYFEDMSQEMNIWKWSTDMLAHVREARHSFSVEEVISLM